MSKKPPLSGGTYYPGFTEDGVVLAAYPRSLGPKMFLFYATSWNVMSGDVR